MKSIKLEFKEKADINGAISTGKLAAFNSTYDKEIILVMVKNPLDNRIYINQKLHWQNPEGKLVKAIYAN